MSEEWRAVEGEHGGGGGGEGEEGRCGRGRRGGVGGGCDERKGDRYPRDGRGERRIRMEGRE